MDAARQYIKGNAVWFWRVVAVLLAVTALYATQAFSAGMTVTAEPLQNTGANGAITFTEDWSAAGGSAPGSVSLIPTGDAHTKLDKPTTNQGTNAKLEVKVQAPTKLNRSFLQFDVSSIPAGSTIDSATMTLCTEKAGQAGMNYDVHRITSAWTELGITHDNQPTVAATATDSIVALATINCTNVWTVTPDVQAWVDGTANYGLRITDQDESSTTQLKQTYDSREGDPGEEPKLDVNYTTSSMTMRHENSVTTLNGSDQVTTATVSGSKDAHGGTINITVSLLDNSSTIVDQGTATLPTATGTYSVVVPMIVGTIDYDRIATVQVIYEAA